MIAIATGTRADWGILRPLAVALRERGADVGVAATHAHLIPELGNTIEEIISDGFTPIARIPAHGTPAEATAMATRGFGEFFASLRPECVIILGDRFEMLGVAAAALFAGVPIVHIAGGTVSEGAFDDQIRNAISQMASLHFPETDECRDRLIGMGISPEKIHVGGALGLTPLDNRADAAAIEDKLRPEVREILRFTREAPALLMTLHAETAPDSCPLEEATATLLEALEPLMKDYRLVITYPNADTDPTAAIRLIKEFAATHPANVREIPSLGHAGYLAVVEASRGVVGNSSSGIVEVPSLGVPTLDIGRRQKGRQHGPSVILSPQISVNSIREGLHKILSPEIQELARRRENPYYLPDSARRMAEKILEFKF